VKSIKLKWIKVDEVAEDTKEKGNETVA